MTRLPRRLRSPLIALAVLALTAGAAAAARPAFSTPDAAAPGLERARDASGLDVPIAGPPSDAAPAARPDAPTIEEEQEPAAEEELAGEHPDNHGAVVSEAAQADEVPAEFDNHGQYVRSVATDNHGHEPEKATGQDRAAEVKPSR